MEAKKEREKGDRKNVVFFLLAFLFFSIVCTVLGITFLKGMKKEFVQNNFQWLAYVYGGVIAFLFVCACVFSLMGKQTLTKTFFLAYVLLFFVILLAYILQKNGFFEVVNNTEKLREYLETMGVWTPVIYIILQFLQVILLPVPGIVSTAVGVAIFGALKTTLYSFIGIFLGSITAFFIGRKWGSKAVAWIVGEETLKKWQSKLKGKDNLFLTLAFILPFFPDDVLCFLAGLSSMSTRYFLIMIFLTRLISILATCYSVNFIPFNTWWGITVWVTFFILVVVLGTIIYKNMDTIQQKIQKWKEKKRKKRDFSK